jgi:hypothetical protein
MAGFPQFLGLATAAALVGAGVAAAAPGSGLQACLAECRKARLSSTDRASCRLDCETDAASDPELIRAQIDRTVSVPRPSAPPASAGEPGCKAACDADRALSVDDRATCKLECDLDANSPVNRNSAYSVQKPAPTPSPAGFMDRCYGSCEPKRRTPTDFAACRLDCETMGGVIEFAQYWVPTALREAPAVTRPATSPVAPPVSATPPVAPPSLAAPTPTRPQAPPATPASGDLCGDELGRCNDRCMTTQRSCERGCGRKHVIETDRETCKLTCETDREVCQGDCLAASATCVNRRGR